MTAVCLPKRQPQVHQPKQRQRLNMRLFLQIKLLHAKDTYEQIWSTQLEPDRHAGELYISLYPFLLPLPKLLILASCQSDQFLAHNKLCISFLTAFVEKETRLARFFSNRVGELEKGKTPHDPQSETQTDMQARSIREYDTIICWQCIEEGHAYGSVVQEAGDYAI